MFWSGYPLVSQGDQVIVLFNDCLSTSKDLSLCKIWNNVRACKSGGGGGTNKKTQQTNQLFIYCGWFTNQWPLAEENTYRICLEVFIFER